MGDLMKRIRSKAGYTLTEMMMVVGVVGMTASTAGFQWVRNRPRQDLNRAAWEVVGILREARSEAARQGVPSVVNINSSRRRITIWTDSNRNGVRDDGEERHLDLSNLRNISIWSYPSSGTFSSLGTFSQGSTAFMIVQVRSHTLQELKTLHIYPNGQIHLADQ